MLKQKINTLSTLYISSSRVGKARGGGRDEMGAGWGRLKGRGTVLGLNISQRAGRQWGAGGSREGQGAVEQRDPLQGAGGRMAEVLSWQEGGVGQVKSMGITVV